MKLNIDDADPAENALRWFRTSFLLAGKLRANAQLQREENRAVTIARQIQATQGVGRD